MYGQYQQMFGVQQPQVSNQRPQQSQQVPQGMDYPMYGSYGVGGPPVGGVYDYNSNVMVQPVQPDPARRPQSLGGKQSVASSSIAISCYLRDIDI